MTLTFHGAPDDVTKMGDDITSDVTDFAVGFYGPIIILTKTPLYFYDQPLKLRICFFVSHWVGMLYTLIDTL